MYVMYRSQREFLSVDYRADLECKYKYKILSILQYPCLGCFQTSNKTEVLRMPACFLIDFSELLFCNQNKSQTEPPMLRSAETKHLTVTGKEALGISFGA